MADLHAWCFTTPRPWSAAEFAGVLADDLCFALAEHAQSGPTGFLIGRVVAGEAEVLTLAVAPDARRAGIATRLLAAFLTTAKQRGAATAFLEVAATNSAALGLYARAGFTQTGLRRGYYTGDGGAGVDAVLLARDL